ncbi:MAG: YiiX/YebB-like N1pC/P60 family cysteine hydrolase [Litorimonas sp.]
MGTPKLPDMTLLDAARILQASYEALPSQHLMQALITDSHAAQERGYYTPQEDEKLRDSFANYLAMRAAIWQMIQAMKPRFKQLSRHGQMIQLSETETCAFTIAFCGAQIIVGTGEYLIDLARGRDMVWQKLDEAEIRYGLARKSFTRLYRQLTSAFRMSGFYQARDYYDAHKDELLNTLERNDLMQIADILRHLNLPNAPRGEHLRRYRRFVRFSMRRRGLSTARKTMFALFEATGSDIAEMKIPLVKNIGAQKRVTDNIIVELKPHLRAGDVIITRHDDAMSNLFLPGFWPHGALYIGSPETRQKLGVPTISQDFQHSENVQSMEHINILEAKKDGVLLRPIEETLQVDAFVVLRPKLTQDQIGQALARGMSHAGKLYDFVFDFATSERLVCTEVIYRAYQGVGAVDFTLSTKAGRKCLSAEDVLNQAVENDWFEPVMIYGITENNLVNGLAARDILSKSFKASFTG